MPLTEQEEFEFLSLERERAMGSDFAGFQEETPIQSNLDKNIARTDKLIAERPSQWQGLKDYVNTLREQPLRTIADPLFSTKSGLALMGGGVGSIESAIANPALSIQRGERPKLSDVVSGIKGEKPGQLGDVMRSVGAPEPIAAAIGMLGLAGVGNLATKGNIAPSVLGKKPIDVALQAKGELVGSYKDVANFVNKLKSNGGKFLNDFIRRNRDYSANKVNSIRKGFWDNYAPQEYKAYQEAIDNLPVGQKTTISGDAMLQNLEKKLVDKQLMNLDGTLNKGFTPADNKLLKAYENMGRKWADSSAGEISLKDVVEEYKNLRGKYTGKPNPIQRGNIEAANDFFNSVSDQIDNKAFSAAKLRYREFKENQQLLHEAIDLYAPKMKTAKGERFLMGGAINKTTQARKTAKLITEKTGQTLKGAKAWTKISDINPLNLIRKR
jgi:hypothetical protein